MHSVLITEYEDDYKHRYDSGVYPTTKTLKSYDGAEKYVARAIYYKFQELEIRPQLKNFSTKNENLCCKKYFNTKIINGVKRFGNIKKIYRKDLTAMQDIREGFLKGEFVPYLIDFEITQDEVDLEDTSDKTTEDDSHEFSSL